MWILRSQRIFPSKKALSLLLLSALPHLSLHLFQMPLIETQTAEKPS